jgi:hypothetical protein
LLVRDALGRKSKVTEGAITSNSVVEIAFANPEDWMICVICVTVKLATVAN